jgi:hypothetical protein
LEPSCEVFKELSCKNFYEGKRFNIVGFKIADPTKFILAPVSNSLMVFHWSTTMFSIDIGMFTGWATFKLSHHFFVYPPTFLIVPVFHLL